jgi:prepilin-type N-terminal cleavage/methylation domain-containing protein
VSGVRRLRDARGYTLIEMLTVMSIMSIVLTGLTTLFVQGTNSERDVQRRFEAQQTARVALDKMRREVHCASSATTTPSTGEQALVTLSLPTQCPTSQGSTQVSWCTVSVSASRWALYRKPGATCDATGVKWADYLTASTIFQYQASSTTELARLRVRFPVDVKTSDATPVYSLCDRLVLRNSLRQGTPAGSLPDC